jgi:hypothetical protein
MVDCCAWIVSVVAYNDFSLAMVVMVLVLVFANTTSARICTKDLYSKVRPAQSAPAPTEIQNSLKECRKNAYKLLLLCTETYRTYDR